MKKSETLNVGGRQEGACRSCAYWRLCGLADNNTSIIWLQDSFARRKKGQKKGTGKWEQDKEVTRGMGEGSGKGRIIQERKGHRMAEGQQAEDLEDSGGKEGEERKGEGKEKKVEEKKVGKGVAGWCVEKSREEAQY